MTFKRVGQVERWNRDRRAYTLKTGYSLLVDGKETQPWVTRLEARAWALRDNARAIFIEDDFRKQETP
jgi:hypothetical protein